MIGRNVIIEVERVEQLLLPARSFPPSWPPLPRERLALNIANKQENSREYSTVSSGSGHCPGRKLLRQAAMIGRTAMPPSLPVSSHTRMVPATLASHFDQQLALLPTADDPSPGVASCVPTPTGETARPAARRQLRTRMLRAHTWSSRAKPQRHCLMSSTRRFFARSAALWFEATGTSGPTPVVSQPGAGHALFGHHRLDDYIGPALGQLHVVGVHP